MNKKVTKFSPEVRERAVRLVREQRSEHPSMWAAVESIAPMIGCTPQTLHEWVKRHQVDHGKRDGVTSDERERLKALEREVKELRRAQRDSQGRERVFRPGGARPPFQVLKAFIDQHRDTFGVEPICKVLRIAPSGYRRHAAQLLGRTCGGSSGPGLRIRSDRHPASRCVRMRHCARSPSLLHCPKTAAPYSAPVRRQH